MKKENSLSNWKELTSLVASLSLRETAVSRSPKEIASLIFFSRPDFGVDEEIEDDCRWLLMFKYCFRSCHSLVSDLPSSGEQELKEKKNF